MLGTVREGDARGTVAPCDEIAVQGDRKDVLGLGLSLGIGVGLEIGSGGSVRVRG